MTCREAIAVLADYLESTMDERTGEQLEAHLADCDECQAYLGTYRRTTQVVAAAGRLEMPDELRSRLRAFLLERLGET